MTKRVALMGGMGYPLTETPGGMPRLKSRLEKAGAEVILVNWAHRQEVYNFMHNFKGFRAYCGDSLGAGSAAQYPGDVTGTVDFIAGFQPSVYDARAHGGYIDVYKNVNVAHCIYDPVWVETLGLGHAQYRLPPGSKTKLIVTQHHGAHPDDWGWSQDLIFNELIKLMK
jgi:hypothetical protein